MRCLQRGGREWERWAWLLEGQLQEGTMWIISGPKSSLIIVTDADFGVCDILRLGASQGSMEGAALTMHSPVSKWGCTAKAGSQNQFLSMHRIMSQSGSDQGHQPSWRVLVRIQSEYKWLENNSVMGFPCRSLFHHSISCWDHFLASWRKKEN